MGEFGRPLKIGQITNSTGADKGAEIQPPPKDIATTHPPRPQFRHRDHEIRPPLDRSFVLTIGTLIKDLSDETFATLLGNGWKDEPCRRRRAESQQERSWFPAPLNSLKATASYSLCGSDLWR